MEFLMQRILKFLHVKATLFNYGLIPSAIGKGLEVRSGKFMILRIEEKEVTKGS
jgi:hypothetical protein